MALVGVDIDEDDSERNEAVSKISAIYGEEAETKSYEELCRMKPIVSIPSSRCITLRETNVSSLCNSWTIQALILCPCGPDKDHRIIES